jgi:hypothetical protein
MIAFIVLAHHHPKYLATLVETLVADGSYAFVHLDARSGVTAADVLSQVAPERAERIKFLPSIECKWGEYSLVEATLAGLKAITSSGLSFTHVVLLSGQDIVIKPARCLERFLNRNRMDFIESVHWDVRWVRDGLQKERLQYRHFFNFKRSRKLFDKCLRVQQALGLRRKPPRGVTPHFGSQWWALRISTCRNILELLDARPDIVRFFRRAWIPDETFFSTLVRMVVEPDEIAGFNLTLAEFDEYGEPLIFHADHLPLLKQSGKFFARKLSLKSSFAWVKSLAASDQPIPTLPQVASRFDAFHEFSVGERWGKWNTKRAGLIYDAKIGGFEWNRKPFFILFGFDGPVMRSVQRQLQGEFIVCDGYLLDPNEVEYAAGCASRALVQRCDSAWLRQAPLQLLPEILNSDRHRLIGFLACPERDRFLAELAKVAEADIILVEDMPQSASNDASYARIRRRQKAATLHDVGRDLRKSGANVHRIRATSLKKDIQDLRALLRARLEWWWKEVGHRPVASESVKERHATETVTDAQSIAQSIARSDAQICEWLLNADVHAG